MKTSARRLRPLQDTLRRAAYRLGYKLVRRGHPLRNYRELLEAMRQQGFQPHTVMDVGVADGTPDLYEAFPHAKHVLVEPLEDFAPALQALARRHNALVIVAAASNRSGAMEISVGNDPRKSSLVREVPKGGRAERRIVRTVALDDVQAAHHLVLPFLIKIDVEGAELDVLAGAERVLAGTEVLIMETTLRPTHGRAAEFHEVVERMNRLGFVVYDIVGAANHPSGGLAHADLVFVKRSGMFAANAAPSQARPG